MIGYTAGDDACSALTFLAVPLATTRGREHALAALKDRRENAPEQIDNASLPAGSPMYYYCKACGHIAETKPEGWFVNPPRKLCAECQALKDLGWLE